MSNIALRVEGLGKKYRIGERREAYKTFRDGVATAAQGSLRKLGHLFGRNGSVQASAPTDYWALRDVSFEVKHGDVVGIIGKNGAGKSTLLKILSRITEPTEGRARVFGRVGSLLEVGTGFHPELTGRENIYMNGAILGMSKADIDRKFDEIVAFAEIDTYLDTPVKRYSSGMQLRLGFAVAAHMEPEILIVDEVLAVGDAAFQKKCMGKMGEVAHGGRTVILVSHQLGALRELCGSGILVTSGRATAFQTIEVALREYLGATGRFCAERTHLRHVSDVRAGDGSSGQVHLSFGEPLVIKVKLKNVPPFSAGLTIGIKDSWGKRLSLFSTNPHDGVMLPPVADAEVTFMIDFCPYGPGEYYVDVAVTEPGVRIIEEAANALKVEVLPVRRGGSLPYGAPYGEFFPAHSWKIT